MHAGLGRAGQGTTVGRVCMVLAMHGQDGARRLSSITPWTPCTSVSSSWCADGRISAGWECSMQASWSMGWSTRMEVGSGSESPSAWSCSQLQPHAGHDYDLSGIFATNPRDPPGQGVPGCWASMQFPCSHACGEPGVSTLHATPALRIQFGIGSTPTQPASRMPPAGLQSCSEKASTWGTLTLRKQSFFS